MRVAPLRPAPPPSRHGAPESSRRRRAGVGEHGVGDVPGQHGRSTVGDFAELHFTSSTKARLGRSTEGSTPREFSEWGGQHPR